MSNYNLGEKLTLDDLTKLDNFGHRKLEELTLIQAFEYFTLHYMRGKEVLLRILELRNEQAQMGRDVTGN